MQPINTAIIAFGFSGSVFHTPIIEKSDHFNIRLVSSSSAEKVHERLPGVEVTDEAEEACQREDIDLVVITSPNTTHYPLAKAAIENGKHVVLEKPFVPTYEEAVELTELAEANDVVLSVYHNRRWDGDFLTIRSLMEAGALGDVHTFQAAWNDYAPEVEGLWREQDLPGSGSWFDLGAHFIDQALELFGMPETIFADLEIQRPKTNNTDYFHVILGYPNQRVILQSSLLAVGEVPRYIVHGTKGSFVKCGFDPQEDMLINGKMPGDRGWAVENEAYYGTFTDAYGGTEKIPTHQGSYESYYEQIAQAIQEDGKNPVTAIEASRVIRLLELAEKSDWEKRVISVSFNE